ncbi:MAG TPA: TrkH family potassium uptake protein [Candidatus Choladousia intestinigallinarum]|nr:TrkH family potassium uptake protein [Candidatus Choladousia intestinigallinarum]
MNFAIVKYILGYVMYIEGAAMAFPLITALLYSETAGWSFAFTGALCFALGFLLSRKKAKGAVIYSREAFVTVAISWILLSIMGAVPFVITGTIPNPIDALFESVSGFTTTGASILTDVEILPKCMLFWRSFTHWLGGMGVLVLLLAFLQIKGGSHMNLMKVESPGPSVNKLVPTVRSTAKILYIIYIALTLAEIILLLLGRAPLFDTLTITFGTAGTGGFGIKNDSMAGYSPYIQIVVTIFMILFGINFSAYFLILRKKFKQALSMEEVRCYLAIILVSILIITLVLSDMYPVWEALRHAAFQVGSIITTTGYSSADFGLWPVIPRSILVTLMFIGACAGSTGGGIKVSRLIILLKSVRKELHLMLHPRSVKKLRMDGRVLEPEVIRTTSAFFVAYALFFVISVLLVGVDGHDLVTNFSAVASALNNIGPGLELVGPMGNFSVFSNFSTAVLTIDMLAGRLEIFPLLLLFTRDTWRRR